ncbi:stanniocalcin-2 [Ambystoma mexicanum]|uniref:stanniocalcin-2 n=1 Tax=Ambystoma mexicanum TaxID=8296 RepID=UPI0037E8BCA9
MRAPALRTPLPLALLLLLQLASLGPAGGTEATDLPESPLEREKLTAQQKGRLSLQNTAEIQHCLVNAGDVGCGVFECFENNSCEIRGLHEICMTFLHNAGKFKAQGKSFIKDALKCKAHGLRHKFSCISRKCPAIKDMVLQLQRECYHKHDLCSAARENVQVIVEMIHFKDLMLLEPYVDLVNILLTCGDDVKEAITRSIQTQCEQNWGSLCSILSFCSSAVHVDLTPTPEKKPVEAARAPRRDGEHSPQMDPERDASKSARGDKDKGSRGPMNVNSRLRTGSQAPKAAHGTGEQADELPASSDIRR